MNYKAIKDALVALTKAVQGIGKVYGEEQHASDWAEYFRLHTVRNPHDETVDIICVAWWSRESSLSSYVRDEAGIPIAQQDTDSWKLTLIYGFHTDTDYPSEGEFNELTDRIREAFRMSDVSAFPGELQELGPLSLNIAGLYVFGDVLCHKAEMGIQLIQRTTSIS